MIETPTKRYLIAFKSLILSCLIIWTFLTTVLTFVILLRSFLVWKICHQTSLCTLIVEPFFISFSRSWWYWRPHSEELCFVFFSIRLSRCLSHVLAEKRHCFYGINSGRWLFNLPVSAGERHFTGSPQGCVLSLLAFILRTNDCRRQHPQPHILKCADDSVILSLLSSDDPLWHHKGQLSRTVCFWTHFLKGGAVWDLQDGDEAYLANISAPLANNKQSSVQSL